MRFGVPRSSFIIFPYPRLSALICGFVFLFLISLFFGFDYAAPSFSPFIQKVSAADDLRNEIEKALYTRQEFLGAQAIVPLPTAEARENLARLAENFPGSAEILSKLAELNEKLGKYDEAEANLNRLAEADAAKLENLAAFYHRRAQFEKEAMVLRKILSTTAAERRSAVFEKLIYTARLHDLQEYLKPEFYAEVAGENPNIFEIFQKLVEKLVEEKNYPEALKFLRAAKAQFPNAQSVLLAKEIEILLATNQPREAENVYHAAFNPFWSEQEAEKYYGFLSRRDRLRAYGAELKAKFRRNPADFDAGVRLALYRRHDYEYGNDEITPVILEIERAKKNWTTEELVTATRLLLQANEGETASRFLYTLFLREDFRGDGDGNFRAQILYQLFEMFSDAENQRLPLTKGDLRFYADAARADTSPGIATGILSLIFSDTRPQKRFDEQEAVATKYFNRAAAYRIFQEYKKEFSTSPELAQMYLDIVRLYTATKETEIAEKTLSEFAERYADSTDFPATALKLADALATTDQPEKERGVYRKLLDYLGKQKNSLAPQTIFNVKPDARNFEITPSRNDGINIPKPQTTPTPGYYFYNENKNTFRDYLARQTGGGGGITYAEVLEKLVASLAKERKTPEILELYSAEIAKYPDEEWLYERRLAWLEKTDFAEEQLKVYQAALARFQSRGWQDKLARWFLRQKRGDDFAAFSEDLAGKLNDAEIQSYLAQFVDGNVSSPGEFEKRLYLKLYETAHARFPHNIAFVEGLLRFYKTNQMRDAWLPLAAEYYFESPEIREAFLDDLAAKGELRNYLQKSGGNGESAIYELFRADTAVRLSNYENAIAAYRKLNEIYPNTPEFSARLVNFTRSLGQKNRQLLGEAAGVAKSQADFQPSLSAYRTQAGEIFAELGDYEKARGEWEKLIATARGDREIYLETATVYWDYFQYEDALGTIKTLREKFADPALYAFEAGAILEALHRQREAIGEYVKALGTRGDDYDEEAGSATQKYKAKKRLANLFARVAANEKDTAKNDLERIIETAFSNESAKRGTDASFLALGYAEFLVKIKQNAKAETILNRAISQSRDAEFLEEAGDFYAYEEIASGRQAALKRLAETSDSPRRKISYYLQLAASFEKTGERNAARAILAQTVRNFPTNFGVLTEASDFYWRLGFEDDSVALLQNALARSRGVYRARLAEKLSKRLIQSDRLAAAERILSGLHAEEKSSTEIFRELAGIYVRAGKSEDLRKIFDETLAALRQNATRNEYFDMEIADLRRQMIDAFTRLKDYQSAIEQHIEIINREPENDELTENALAYAERYGGAETLLNYYLKTSAEAFKNYRWNVVLARIYEARKDWENAAKNYRAAIDNQPEMIELYLALAEVEARRNNFDEAVRNLDIVLELTNDEAQYVKKKIEILKKAGRPSEIEAEKAKLPAEKEEKKTAPADRFAEARELQNTEKEAARRLYREAFEKLLENPLGGSGGELKAADITAYVQSVREEEPLNQIHERLWRLREKLIAAADGGNSSEAVEARKRLATLDAALTEAVGGIAKSVATDEELVALRADLQRRLEDVTLSTDPNRTAALIQDLSRRAGFGDLEETILLRKLDESTIDRRINLQNLFGFYNERGAYQKAFDALEKYGGDNNPALRAEAARLVNNREKELEALREIYWKKDEKISVSTDANVARYLEILHAENREELKSLTGKSSARQLQLINFLLGKGERELAHAAIENANLPPVWKISRHAETSLALKEFDENAECYFCDALQLDLIGNLVRQKPDKDRFLINADWFRLTRQYGEWLAEKNASRAGAAERKDAESEKYLTALVENYPRSSAEQAKLGDFYLRRGNQPEKAIEHFRLAVEINDEDRTNWAKLGAAYHAAGRKDWAQDCWQKALDKDDEIAAALAYFRVLQEYGLSDEARENLPPVIVKFLRNFNADKSEDFQNLIRLIAASFDDEAEKAAYSQNILKERPTDTSLAAMLVGESLIGKNRQGEFYELLIARSEALSDYDYDSDFRYALQKVWAVADAESIYEQENDYQPEKPENERFEHQRNYLAFLVAGRENARAEQLIAEIEKSLLRRYARPNWLRLAKIRIAAREGKFDRAEAERLIGIAVSDAATEIKLPNVERFNDVRQALREEDCETEAAQISEAFFARNLALGQFDAANFAGLSRTFFQTGEPEKAVRLLQLMIDVGDAAKKETALAEIAVLDAVKTRGADATKLSNNETFNSNQSGSLRLAAEIAAEFRQTDAAIAFRRQLLEANPLDATSRVEIAGLLAAKGEKQEAANLLTQIIADRNSPRAARWRARMLLLETGASAEFADVKADAFSQFYKGLFAAQNGRNETAAEFFINCLIADKDAVTAARAQLIKLYVLSNQPFAALKFAEADESPKSDEMLQTLSEAAEKTGDYGKAVEFEKTKSARNEDRIRHLENLYEEKNRRATDLTVDLENTRKL
jgi:tetratricopeptide (TPR) repeat protein